MKIQVKVKPNAKETKVVELGNLQFQVAVKAPPKEGRANEAVVEALSEYFGKPKSNFKILNGLNAKNKIINVI